MLSPKKEQFDVENNPTMRKKVKFVPKASITTKRMISIKPTQEGVQHLDDKRNYYKSNNIIWLEIEWGDKLNHLRGMLMQIK